MQYRNKLAKSAILLITLGILASISIHFFREGGDPIGNTLSDYAGSEYGFIITFGFYLFIISGFIISKIFNTYNHWALKTSSYIFFLCTLSMALLTVFHIDTSGTIEGWKEMLHIITAGIMFSGYPAIMILVGHRFKNKKIRVQSYISFLVSVLMTIYSIKFTLENLTTGLLETSYLGLTEKVGVLIITIWIVTILLNLDSIDDSEKTI